ncbi:MAG TPA: condensation domain-containing protein, partial [Acidimicrobiales bacterium]|nr:condensation domain-containing protein [Acidimicrobiales bacterium]
MRVDDVVVAVDGGGALSRRDWEAGAAAVGRALAGRGVRPGARVGLLFDGRHWPAFAVAHAAVCAAGAEPVLLSPAAPAAAPAATGLLCSPGLAPVGCRVWVETVDVECGPSRADLPKGGVLVHALAPGSAGSPRVLALVRAGTPAVAQWPFDPDRFCALVAEREAAACGLTPALAAAVLASGAAPRHDLSSLDTVLLSAAPSGGLRAALEAALPGVDIEVPGPPRPAGDPAPAAVSQEAMVWHEQFVPGSFNLPCLVRRHQGPLDVDALARAFTELVRRHEPLRSTFTLDGGRLGQVIGPPGPVPLPVVDLSGLDGDASPAFWLHLPADRRATAAKAEVDLLLADASRRPFDLAAGPLFEPRLVRLGHDDHLLVVRLHHTVFDDWSVDLFRRELSALYTA